MKKLIVIAMILMASVCYADMKDDIFKLTNTTDVTNLKEDPGNNIFGITKSSQSEFFMSVKEYFMMNDGFIIKDWTPVDNSYCVAFTDRSKVYAMCLEGQIVVMKEIK